MKAMILLFLLSTPAYAGMTIKAGGDPSEESHGLIVSAQPEACSTCLSPYFVRLSNEYGKHDGVGVDVRSELLKRDRDMFLVNFGAVGFRDSLNNGNNLNFHAGIGFQINLSKHTGVVLSYDVFDPLKHTLDRDVPDMDTIHMLSVGVNFR